MDKVMIIRIESFQKTISIFVDGVFDLMQNTPNGTVR